MLAPWSRGMSRVPTALLSTLPLPLSTVACTSTIYRSFTSSGSVPLSGSVWHNDGEVRASQPPLLFIHGLLGSGANFRTPGKKLARVLQAPAVVLCDVRNHGDSPHHPDMDYRLLAADVRELAGKHLGSDISSTSIDVIGHSMGGRIAMTWALEDAIYMNKLVVVDVSPVDYRDLAGGSGARDLLSAMQSIDLSTIKSRRDADQAMSKFLSDPGLRAFGLQNMAIEREDGGTRAYWRSNINYLSDAMGTLGKFGPGGDLPPAPQLEALFLAGGKSHYIEESHHDEIRRLFPRAQIESIPGAGHWIHADKTNEFVASCARFLQT